jgi:hypothetical protein
VVKGENKMTCMYASYGPQTTATCQPQFVVLVVQKKGTLRPFRPPSPRLLDRDSITGFYGSYGSYPNGGSNLGRVLALIWSRVGTDLVASWH